MLLMSGCGISSSWVCLGGWGGRGVPAEPRGCQRGCSEVAGARRVVLPVLSPTVHSRRARSRRRGAQRRNRCHAGCEERCLSSRLGKTGPSSAMAKGPQQAQISTTL